VEEALQRGLGLFEDLGGFQGTASTGVTTPSIGNYLIEQVLVRLEHHLAFGEWEVRVACLQALAKIAFRSSFRVRLHVYSFLQLVVRDNSGSLATEALLVYTTLHKLMLAFEAYSQGGPSAVDAQKHKELLEEVKRFTALPPGFNLMESLVPVEPQLDNLAMGKAK